MSTTPPSQQYQRAADLVRLLRTAFPKNWEKHLRNLGVPDPADLPPAELDEFTNEVFWRVKQMGIKDPAAWLVTYRTLMQASTVPLIPVELNAPAETAARHLGETGLRRAREGQARGGPGEDLDRHSAGAGGSDGYEPDDES
jgi:hypothetical protein